MLRECPEGHITGYRHCAHCGQDGFPIQKGHTVQHRAIDKRLKRRITQAIRDAGGIPVADRRKQRSID